MAFATRRKTPLEAKLFAQQKNAAGVKADGVSLGGNYETWSSVSPSGE
jgi:hypothetical protein